MSSKSSAPASVSISRPEELDQYVRSFTASSDRVRHLVLISVVASILAFVAYRNSLPSNWLDARATMARIAYRNKLWDQPMARLKICREQGPAAAGFVDSCNAAGDNIIWVLGRRHGEASLKAHLEKIEQLRAEKMLLVSVPWLGIHFDINDLGAFSAISFSLLSMTLCFAMARQHENLYLCLWKVRRVAERERRYDDGESQANFLYHALAMAQVFTRPPTLARWRSRHIGRSAVRFLLFVPLAVQLLITAGNAKTFGFASQINSRAAALSMGFQLVFLIPLIACTLACCAYSRTSDIRWSQTFFAINPRLRNCVSVSWIDWLRLGVPPRWRFASDTEGNLFVGECREEGGGSAWKLGLEKKNIEILPSYSSVPACVRAVLDEHGNEYSFQPSADDHGVPVLVRISKEGEVVPLAGGRAEIADGTGTEAGFSSIQALIYDAESRCLYAIDQGCLRRIDTVTCEVETVGGTPLACSPRSLWPRLPGLALHGGRLFVADYDNGCVLALQCEEWDPKEIWRSRGSWSPAGIAVQNGSIYLLEHRSLTVVGIILGYLGCRARIWEVPKVGAHLAEKGRLLLKISDRGCVHARS